MATLQRVLSVIYPDQCLLCDAQVDRRGALCPECWSDTPFITGHVCDACGAPLTGVGDGIADHCDDCLATPRPWDRGRSALIYAGAARRLVLRLKHADRTDLAPPAARWMAAAAAPLLSPDTMLVPIPIHWSRRIRRKYNQSAELVRALAGMTGMPSLPDALVRTRRTARQEGMDTAARARNQSGSIALRPAAVSVLAGSHVLLIDDVMTSGATLGEAAEAVRSAGAGRISCVTLARAVRSP